MQAKHPGLIHFEMEKAGKPGRWNTFKVFENYEKIWWNLIPESATYNKGV